MKRLLTSLFTVISLFTFAGCKHPPIARTVCLVDISTSITPAGVQYEFKVVDDLVDRMHRGDRLTIIPITGNAMNETSGHILRFSAPTERQSYDHDLVLMRQQAHDQIKAMRQSALDNPASEPTSSEHWMGARKRSNQVRKHGTTHESRRPNHVERFPGG